MWLVSIFFSLLFFLIQLKISRQNSTEMERYVVFFLNNIKGKERKITQSSNRNKKSNTPRKKMSGGIDHS